MAGVVSKTHSAELLPYNPPVSGSRVPEAPAEFYQTFGARARNLPNAEKQRLRDSLYREMNTAVQRGDIARAQHYSRLIRAADF
jgi:hypothetical protein